MSINNFDLNLLKVFVAVADNGGFTKAAQKLFIEQPSVTRAIQRLEGEVGPLFLRTKRRVQLTARGSELLVLAKNILEAGNDFLSVASNKESELTGTIKFAAESPISSLFVPGVIQKISKQFPRLWPMMFTGITDDSVRRIRNRELEFGVFFYEGHRFPDLEYGELVSIPFKIVSSTKIDQEGMNSFIGSREINEPNLVSLPTFNKLKKHNKSLRIKYSANDLHAYLELLSKGLGIGLLPECMIRNELKRKSLRILHPGMELDFPIWLVTKKNFPLSREAQSIVSLLKELTMREHQ